MSDIIEIGLQKLVECKASDLHLGVGSVPFLRIEGQLQALGDTPVITDDIHQWLIKQEVNLKNLNDRSKDFIYDCQGLGRFRTHLYAQNRGLALAFRWLPPFVPTLSDLQLPEVMQSLSQQNQGLILITGSTGSGKSSTLAAIVQEINKTCRKHIISLEDPIEFEHQSQSCLVHQRQRGIHFESFALALQASLREDPDVIVLGELRELETLRMTLSAAETGHLVIATLHALSAVKAIDRITDFFSGEEKNAIRLQLAESLIFVVAQKLFKCRQGGRIAACEVLVVNQAVRALIRENKTIQIHSLMQTNTSKGMLTMAQHLEQLRQLKLVE